MKITDALRGEHDVLRCLLEHCGRAAAGGTLQETRDGGAALQTALAEHTQAEGELLFRELEPFIAPRTGPLTVSRMEQTELDGSLARLAAECDLEGAQLLLHYAVEVARLQLGDEERVLFPLAERLLGEDRLAELGAAWASRYAVAGPGSASN